MGWLIQTFRSLQEGAAAIARRPYGVIETGEGKLIGIHLRPWPKLISFAEVAWHDRWLHRRGGLRYRDRCLLYYNQPRRHRNFIALKYVVSTAGTTLATFRLALTVLDEIAEMKRIDAIVCEVTNAKISARLLHRWGWERHVLQSRRRHYIKRLYEIRSAARNATTESEQQVDADAFSIQTQPRLPALQWPTDADNGRVAL